LSHITTVKTELRNLEMLQTACRLLDVSYLGFGEHKVYTAQVLGHAFQLDGWKYPCVVNIEKGSVTMDNSQGHWGNMDKFDQFTQRYAVEAAKHEASRLGFNTFTEQTLEDGRIKLVIDVPETQVATSAVL